MNILAFLPLQASGTRETAPAVAETPGIKLFGKWGTDDVQISDISLQDYINPLQVLVNAIINSGPHEDSTCIGFWLLCTGAHEAREAAFCNIKTIAECLADELINAAKGSSIKKKDELEHVAKSNH
uniref:Small ribosomal subunit protein uS7 domain-containing protein n=1 Tax=Podarcis muralis TaxID=64176 RepID=A0A670I321_PODMU